MLLPSLGACGAVTRQPNLKRQSGVKSKTGPIVVMDPWREQKQARYVMDTRTLIAVWRERAVETRTQAEQFQDGSISHTILLTIAESYERLADREEFFSRG